MGKSSRRKRTSERVRRPEWHCLSCGLHLDRGRFERDLSLHGRVCRDQVTHHCPRCHACMCEHGDGTLRPLTAGEVFQLHVEYPEFMRDLEAGRVTPNVVIDAASYGKRPWPDDAIMVVSPPLARYAGKPPPFAHKPHPCRDCGVLVAVDAGSLRQAEGFPGRCGRPVKFFCDICVRNYDLEDIDIEIDNRDGRGADRA